MTNSECRMTKEIRSTNIKRPSVARSPFVIRYSRRPSIDASSGARLGNDHFAQKWQLRLQPVPDPGGDVFARRILQAANFVEVTMVELFPDRPEGFRDIGKIHQPPELRVTFAGDDDFRLETM